MLITIVDHPDYNNQEQRINFDNVNFVCSIKILSECDKHNVHHLYNAVPHIGAIQMIIVDIVNILESASSKDL
ncbi:hypothetical protein BLOT_016120 [Blomia tropicalis]|nr:hypothetical protein BLOT_016120 [Blomia tropicalis]